MPDLIFPKGFLWGAATSAHQVEGDNHNDWTVWEAAGHAAERSGRAAEHWKRYKQDYDLLEDMHLNAYRFSVEWSRIEPLPGEYNKAALKHYKEMVHDLKKRGIEPMVTLHHFTSPIWISDQGGWAHNKTVSQFVDFVDVVVEALGPEVTMWCTVNEPSLVSGLGYLETIFPPGKRSPWLYLKVRRNLARAHNQAYDHIHKKFDDQGWKKPMVGFAHHGIYVKPRGGGSDKVAARIFNYLANGYFLERARGRFDFLGLNYYLHRNVFFQVGAPWFLGEAPDPGLAVNDLGWRIYPEGLYHMCKQLARYGKPIIVTENGVADEHDAVRPKALIQHLVQLHRAMSEGVKVLGYFHWSLIDNFEWQNGYHGRFGLYAVDFTTQKRTPRHSAKIYSDIAKSSKISAKLAKEYR